MKTTHIIGIVAIAIAIGILITSGTDASKYVPFEEAHQMGKNNNESEIHVIGELKKDEAGKIIGIQEGADKVTFSFLMVDNQQREEQVFCNFPVPPDFRKSEKVVVVGRFHDDTFMADKVLLKCPSKYEEEKEFSANTP